MSAKMTQCKSLWFSLVVNIPAFLVNLRVITLCCGFDNTISPPPVSLPPPQLAQVIRGVVKKLDKDLVTVEEFVEHLTILSRICVQMPSLVRQYQFLIQLYCIFKEYNISISPEELALYQHLVPSFQHLKSAVMICETKRDDNVLKFSADVSKQLNQLRYDLVLVKKKVGFC